MSIRFAKFLDANDVWEKVQARVEQATGTYDVYRVIRAVVAEHDGTKITKHLTNKVAKALEPAGYTVQHRNEYGMFKIVVWKQPKWDERVEFLLGYNHHPIVSANAFDTQNTWAALEKGRAEKLSELTFEKVFDLVNTWNTLLGSLQQVQAQAEAYEYPLSSLFDL